ncbi:unnamed protein product [Protopolystoma xenopodis]|uniref:Uncharacterized protein n=1 Tax=Protopolystoma xenopodis TaxID=117903 RepID=A0A3S4ZS82_9PLAT|nr:unnamed protein product [Protopolystoma xenopodis]
MNRLSAVFAEPSPATGEHEFWSLTYHIIGWLPSTFTSSDSAEAVASSTGRFCVVGSMQVRTDDFVYVHRSLWQDQVCISRHDQHASGTLTPGRRLLDRCLSLIRDNQPSTLFATATEDSLSPGQSPKESSQKWNYPRIWSAEERIVVRVYRLWKDASGLTWLEGGAFLRPYDLPPNILRHQILWQPRELVYDEASRLVLPLQLVLPLHVNSFVRRPVADTSSFISEAPIGPCFVLSPAAFRAGRPAGFEPTSLSTSGLSSLTAWETNLFICDKLFERPSNSDTSTQTTCRLEEISPGYLKVSMKVNHFDPSNIT